MFGSAAKAVLFFEMAQQELTDTARERAAAAPGPKARKDYDRFRPIVVKPSRVNPLGKAGQSVIVEGYPL